MSRPLSVYHRRLGRATVDELNRPIATHAHREGHLIYYLDEAPASPYVSGTLCGLTVRYAVAVSAWEPHGFIPGDGNGIYLVLYIDPSWFQRMARPAHALLRFGRSEIEMTPRIQAIIREVASLLEDYDSTENF